jgi:hypothetical protein
MSLAESDLAAALRRRDLADLEEAIALSLQVEQHRLEQRMEKQLEDELRRRQAEADAAAEAEAAAAAAAATTVAATTTAGAASAAPEATAEQKYDCEPAAESPVAEVAIPAPIPDAAAALQPAVKSTTTSLLGDLPSLRPSAQK